MAAYSPEGPAADGRTKPDIVAPGTDITRRGRAPPPTPAGPGRQHHPLLHGRHQHVHLLAAGSALLVRQYATDVLGLDSPSAALLKAALAGGARSLSFGQYGHRAPCLAKSPLPRPNSGMAD